MSDYRHLTGYDDCPRCGGSGGGDGAWRCWQCNGTGVVKDREAADDVALDEAAYRLMIEEDA